MKQVTSRILINACAAALAVATSGAAFAQTEGNRVHAHKAGELMAQFETQATTTARADVGTPAQLEGNSLLSAPDTGVALRSTVNHGWIAPAQDHTVRTNIGQRGEGVLANSSAFPRVQM